MFPHPLTTWRHSVNLNANEIHVLLLFTTTLSDGEDVSDIHLISLIVPQLDPDTSPSVSLSVVSQ